MRYQKSFKELFLYCDRAIFELDVQSDEVTLLAGPCSEMQSWKNITTSDLCDTLMNIEVARPAAKSNSDKFVNALGEKLTQVRIYLSGNSTTFQ